jgi:hypothetical protein
MSIPCVPYGRSQLEGGGGVYDNFQLAQVRTRDKSRYQNGIRQEGIQMLCAINSKYFLLAEDGC